jgi:hypothetical protein
MPQPGHTDDVLRSTLDLVTQYRSVTAAALAAGIKPATMSGRWLAARTWAQAQGMEIPTLSLRAASAQAQPPEKPFEMDPLPDELPTAEDLRARRKQAFTRKSAAKDARKLIPVRVTIDGPYGIAHFGDPHVDDDGTDIGLLERHVAIVNKTEGLFAGNVGDYSNNWIGRLARLYGEQSLSAAEAWVLVEWLVGSTDWLYLIGGNHDCWSGAGDPIQWIAKQTGTKYERHGARLNLIGPDGREVRVNARHDFTGHSQWNTAHGVSKAVQMGWRDHVLTCGHKHTSGYQILKDPSSGLISHAIRAASYKTFDRYADEKGLPDQSIFVCPVTIIDTRYPENDVRMVTTILDPEEGADYLTWKRRKWARGSRAA